MAAAVVYQRATTRAVLWDLSYILNHGYRIAHGDLPYRDFPLPHAPGTFLLQAFLIKVAGPSYRLVTGYVVVASGVSVALTYAVIRSLVRDRSHPVVAATLLTLPLVVVGIYTLYPHPFYDPDASLFMLFGIAGVLAVRRVTPTPVVAVPVGVLLTVPIFMKQNVGLAFFGLMHLALLTFLFEGSRAARVRWGYMAAGSAGGLLVAIAVIQLSVGIDNYIYWTVEYASQRRLGSSLMPRLDIYGGETLWMAVGAVVVAVLLLHFTRHRLVTAVAALLLFLAPAQLAVHAWNGRVDDIVDAWPLGLALSCILSVRAILQRSVRFEDVLPFVVAGVAHASFLSQGIVGSTYGIWPLLLIAFATATRNIPWPGRGHLDAGAALPVALAVVLTWSGIGYLLEDVRLTYAPKQSGPLVESSVGTLGGFRERGTVVPQLDALLRYVETNVPEDDAILTLMGEDPLFFALDRRPLFPVLTFDDTVNPYGIEELSALMRRHDVRWVIVKDAPQIGSALVPENLVAKVTNGFELQARLPAYRIFRRVAGTAERVGAAMPYVPCPTQTCKHRT